MKKSRVAEKTATAEHCTSCSRAVAGEGCVLSGSSQRGNRLLCWRCFNTEVAEADGLSRFEHLEFKPVRLTDCGGRWHEFHFRTRLMGHRVVLDAYEMRKGAPAGYEFSVAGEPEADLFMLMGQLMEKLRRALAVKHIRKGRLGLQATGQVVRGRIGWDDEEEGRVPMMVVDGQEVSWEEFGRMVMAFEGWQFRLEMLDRSEEA